MMRKGRFNARQIISFLQEIGQGASAQEPFRKHDISDSTFCKWQSKYVGLDVASKRRLGHFETEPTKAKQVTGQRDRVQIACDDEVA